MTRIVIVIFAAFLLGALPLNAQDAGEKPEFYKVFNVKLKPGKAVEADAFVNEYLTPVDDAIGRKVITFVYQTGAWDRITYFPARTTETGIDTIPSEQNMVGSIRQTRGWPRRGAGEDGRVYGACRRIRGGNSQTTAMGHG